MIRVQPYFDIFIDQAAVHGINTLFNWYCTAGSYFDGKSCVILQALGWQII